MKVLKFGAVWCSGCLVMRPKWEEIEKEIPNLITEYYDFDKDKETVDMFNIDSKLPVCVFLDKDNKEILRFTGEAEKGQLLRAISENINK